jgi:glycosyltransferase involved in cell wall biosynthesis
MKPASNQRCIVNLGLFKTGTTALTKTAESLGLRVYSEFPSIHQDTEFPSIAQDVLKEILLDPEKAIHDFVMNHVETFVDCIVKYDFVCDGWFALLPLAPLNIFQKIKDAASKRGTQITFVATQRDEESYLQSELHHWVRYDLEKTTKLTVGERSVLEQALRSRYSLHKKGIEGLRETEQILCLGLNELDKGEWANALSKIAFSKRDWDKELLQTGIQNGAPQLPVQGILLTMRIVKNFDECLQNVSLLLSDIEMDTLCTYMIILALDDDEYDTLEAKRIKAVLEARPRLKCLHLTRNPPHKRDSAPHICQIWAAMAKCAWEKGADWVVFLGDDIRIKCPFHYRAIYRAFLDSQTKFNLPKEKYFGCPWFNDEGFKGFPTFPIVGKEHFHIFSGLIPDQHRNLFVNQDLDPYLQRIYLKFGAAPWLQDVLLTNSYGGSDDVAARYVRISALSWRDRVLDDACVEPIRSYLQEYACPAQPGSNNNGFLAGQDLQLVDVVIPSYRVNVEYLQRICSIQVPSFVRTTFIIVVDNPSHLVKVATEKFGASPLSSHTHAASLLEQYLATKCASNIRVRCNIVNKGASESRNRGIKESSAEYILFLDDDVIPEDNLLHAYSNALRNLNEESILGLVGLVRFPRENLSLLHAAVLMSYLTFSFEIADSDIYEDPAWGVTANILYKRFPGMTFDTRYAKSGGGEDVDFALRSSKENGNLSLRSCPSARVNHLFWHDNVFDLCCHFFNWAIGDSALFYRFDEPLVYYSFPNFVETWLFLLLPCILATEHILKSLAFGSVGMFICDVATDLFWKRGAEFKHRRSLLEKEVSPPFAILAHALANFYVIALECGRVYGHLKRGHLKNISRRFDWHIGRLENAKKNFVKREEMKFITFMVVIAIACRSF